jgi:hypothetical protein
MRDGLLMNERTSAIPALRGSLAGSSRSGIPQ